MAAASVVLASDKMRKVVEKEGIEARNLLNWNVPLTEKGSLEGSRTAKKPPASPRPQSASPKPPTSTKDTESQFPFRTSKRCQSLGRPKTRVRSASAGRNPEKDLRARYWAFLFENLYRAVDEIYQTCEMDESIVESKEAIMMLENYSKEFRALIQWLNISKNYENTEPPNRPTSLTWEVRKSLPSKGLLKTVFLDKLSSGCSPMKKPINVDIPSDPAILSTAVQTERSPTFVAASLSTSDASPKPNPSLTETDMSKTNSLSNIQSLVFTDNKRMESLRSHGAGDCNNTDSKVQAVIDETVCFDSSNEKDVANVAYSNQKQKDAVNIKTNLNETETDNQIAMNGALNIKPVLENTEKNTNQPENSIEVTKLNATSTNTIESVNDVSSNCNSQGNDIVKNAKIHVSTGNISQNDTSSQIVSPISNDLNTNSNVNTISSVIVNTNTVGSSKKEAFDQNLTLDNKQKDMNSNNKFLNINNNANAASSEMVDTKTLSVSKKKVIDRNITLDNNIKDVTPINKDFNTNMDVNATSSVMVNTNAESASIKEMTHRNVTPANNKREVNPNNSYNTTSPITVNEVSKVTEKYLPKSYQSDEVPDYAMQNRNKDVHSIAPETLNLPQKNENDVGDVSNNKCKKNEVVSSRKIEEINNLKNKFHQTTSVQKVAKVANVEKLCNLSTTTVRPKTYPSTTSNVLYKQQRPTEAKTIGPKLVKYPTMTRNVNEVKKYGTNSTGNLSERKPFRTGNYEPTYRNLPGTTFVRKPFSKATSAAGSNVINQRLRPSQHHIGNHLRKDQQQTGSSSSLSSTSSVKSWADKVKGQELQTDTGNDLNKTNADDTDGWETVRSRTRCRNSPAKKLLPSNGASQAAVAAQISQNKMGGFPYTCTSNALSIQKTQPIVKVAPQTSKTNSNTSNTKKMCGNDEENSGMNSVTVPKSNDVGSVKSQVCSGKLVKEKSASKMEIVKKNDVGKQPADLNTKITKSNCALKVKQPIKTSNFHDEKKANLNKTSEKNVSRSSNTVKQLSLDDTQCTNPSKQGNKKFVLKKTYSNSALETKKNHTKTNTTDKVLKTTESNECKEPTISCSVDISKDKAHNVESLNTKSIDMSLSEPSSSQENQEECSLDEKHSSGQQSVDQDSETKSDDEKTSDSAMEMSDKADTKKTDCTELKKSVSYHDLDVDESDVGLTSDDQDGATSQDEGDAQTLELYEKLMRDEAQERVHQLGLSWGEQMDHLDMELRTPGRALQMHEKLSSPFRKRSLSETIRRQEERQLKAQEQRERLLEEKAQRFKDIQKKVEEMKALKEKRQERQRILMEQKLQRAEEKRKKELDKIIKKAHDEEEKVNEIAFINTLEAQNKRHDLISKEKDHEARLQDIQGERQRRLEEKAAKEAAAEERRKALEAERQARLMEMQEKRKQRDLKIEQQLIEKEKERLELANQKARDRELRREALNAAQQATLEVLQKKIQLKQEESARRHEENMEQIRLKAFELSVRRYSSYNDDAPQLVPYDTKKICTLCNVLIGSEVYLLSHLRGKKHQETVNDQHQGQDPSTEELELYNLKHIVDAPTDQLDPNIVLDKERQKALKKRCKKLRQRMTNRGIEYKMVLEKSSQPVTTKYKTKMLKVINEIKKCTSIQEKGLWDINITSSLEKILTDMERLFETCSYSDKVEFPALGGTSAIIDMLKIIAAPTTNSNTVVSSKLIIKAHQSSKSVFESCYENCIHLLYTNKIGIVLDLLIQRLNILIPDNFCKLLLTSSGSTVTALPVDIVASEIMHFLGIIITCLSNKDHLFNESQTWVIEEANQKLKEEFPHRVQDVISYVVSIGIVDRLSQYFTNVRGSIDTDPDVSHFVLQSMSFLTALVKLFSDSYDSVFDKKKTDDATQLIATLKVTDMISVVSLLYCILLHDGSPSLGETIPSKLPEHTIVVAMSALGMLNQMAAMNLHIVQGMLGSEGLSLQLRHITSYLLWYCSHWTSDILLHEVILLIGYFTALNADNQLIIQAGQRPTVLQQLCSLPFCYFSDSTLTDILFPTLIACCYNSDCNKAILQQEMSCDLLSNYIEAQQLDIHQAALFPSKSKKVNPSGRWRLLARFPKANWTAAKSYFSTTV